MSWDGIKNKKIEAEKESPPSAVTSYKLSDEELEKYRSNTTVSKVTKKPVQVGSNPVRKELSSMQKELTKEVYLKLHGEGKSNREIMDQYGLHNVAFYKLKNSWGLVNNKTADDPKEVLREKAIPEPPVKKKDHSQAMKELKEELDKYPKRILEAIVPSEPIEPTKQQESKFVSADAYNDVKAENKRLQVEIDQLRNEKEELKYQCQTALFENATLEDKVRHLSVLEKKYIATSAALRIHLPE